MKEAKVTFFNNTDEDIIFGLFNAVDNTAQAVPAGNGKSLSPNKNSGEIKIEANARTIAAWMAGKDGLDFYPNNNLFYPQQTNPYLIVYVFDDNKTYNCYLTSSKLYVEPA
jgi:hypothetical protein